MGIEHQDISKRAAQSAADAENMHSQAEELEARLRGRKEAQDGLLESGKKAGAKNAEVDQHLADFERAKTKLMLADGIQLEQFNARAKTVLGKYHEFDSDHASVFGVLPKSEKTQTEIQAMLDAARKAYEEYSAAYARFPKDSDGGVGSEWKKLPEDQQADLWMNLTRAVEKLEELMGGYETVREYAKTFEARVARYVSKESEAETHGQWKEANERRLAFLREHPDATKDDETLALIRKGGEEAWALYQSNHPNGGTDTQRASNALFAFDRIKAAMDTYDRYKQFNEILGDDGLQVASGYAVPEKTDSVGTTAESVEPTKTDIPRTTQADIPLTMPEATVSEPVVPLPDTTPPVIARREQANETPDIASRNATPIPRANIMEQVPLVTEPVTVPEEPQPEEVASNEPKKQPERIRMERSELGSLLRKKGDASSGPEAVALDPTVAAEQEDMDLKFKQLEAIIADMNEDKKAAATGPAVTMPETVVEAETPAAEGLAVTPETLGTKESSPEPVVSPEPQPKAQEETRPVAEVLSKPSESVALSNGVIDIAGKDVYLAYYLADGSRSVNFIRLGGSATSVNMPGRFTAERTANGWSVRPAAGLKGTFLLRADGVDNWVYLDRNAVVRGNDTMRPAPATRTAPVQNTTPAGPSYGPQYQPSGRRFQPVRRFFGRFRRR